MRRLYRRTLRVNCKLMISLSRRVLLLFILLTLPLGSVLWAEKVADLPAPTGYVNDFAGVLSDSTAATSRTSAPRSIVRRTPRLPS